MADARIFDLTERATPSAGDFFVLDNAALSEAKKFDATKPLLKSAGTDQRITGVLYLDPGVDDAAKVLNIPVTSEDGADISLNVGGTVFDDVRDVIFNWGFNVGGGGPAAASKHAWYLQLEYDYFVFGDHWVEYHLQFFAVDGSPNLRPFAYRYLLDGSEGYVTHRASHIGFMNMAGDHTALSFTLGADHAASNVVIDAPFRVNLPASNANALYIFSTNGDVPVIQVDTVGNDLIFRGGYIKFLGAAGEQRAYIDANGINFWTAGNVQSLAGNMQVRAIGGHVILNSAKATTGDPTPVEGLIYINTFDNALKMYADGAWRTLATW